MGAKQWHDCRCASITSSDDARDEQSSKIQSTQNERVLPVRGGWWGAEAASGWKKPDKSTAFVVLPAPRSRPWEQLVRLHSYPCQLKIFVIEAVLDAYLPT